MGHRAEPGVATFYPYLPDLPIAQVMFLTALTVARAGRPWLLAAGSGGRRRRAAAAVSRPAGALAAGTAVALTGTGQLDSHGHDRHPGPARRGQRPAAADYPVCSHTAIPVCLQPRLRRATCRPRRPPSDRVLSEVAGLPGAPARISQAAAAYQQGPGNAVRSGWLGRLSAARHQCSACFFPSSWQDPR